MKIDRHKLLFFFETSAIVLAIGVFLHFAFSMLVVLLAPLFIDKAWIQPSSYYQQQMYEVADPNLYVGSRGSNYKTLMYVHHLTEGKTLLAFLESETIRIIAPEELKEYVTKLGEPLKLTSKIMLLRKPEGALAEAAENLRQNLFQKQKELTPDSIKIDYEILELYNPGIDQAFSVAETGGIFESFIDKDFIIIEENPKEKYFSDPGVIYVKNPREFRISKFITGEGNKWIYDPQGKPIENLNELTGNVLGFRSRKELIEYGEDIFAKEGCWYCHTDQTRTLVQDLVLNGSDSYPAPPSSPNEYIYENVTFPGTRRIGYDLSRVGVKRPSRDWHRSHFWSPKTASVGSIMPAFRHFFDDNPTGTAAKTTGVPDYKFEAVYQYLMTKGTRITPPTQAWWLGKDPVRVLEIIEGRKRYD